MIAERLPEDLFPCSEQNEKKERNVLVVTAMLNLPELLGLRPDLRKHCDKIVLFFHENQLAYPRSVDSAQNTFNLCYNQIISCTVADKVLFNSEYNRSTFLNNLNPFMNKIPTANRPTTVRKETIESKTGVLYLPVHLPQSPGLSGQSSSQVRNDGPLHIVWPHRWEHDKGREEFVELMSALGELKVPFCLSVLGFQAPSSVASFEQARKKLKDHEAIQILHWGALPRREEYIKVLLEADVVLSTAIHEFFGLSVLEAALCGCAVVAPNGLAYQELYPGSCLYRTPTQAVKKLKAMINYPAAAQAQTRTEEWQNSLARFQTSTILAQWFRELT